MAIQQLDACDGANGFKTTRFAVAGGYLSITNPSFTAP
jgi:hypothetical protein